MATAYTSLLGLALPVTGELSGSWGDTVNDSITSLLDSAISGTTTLSADADVTLTSSDGVADQARQAILLWTAGGSTTRNITAPAHSKAYFVINKTSSTQSIVIRGAGPTTGVTVLAGTQSLVVWNGADFVEVASGNVDGPASSTDNAVARFDGTTGKLIQNSVVTIADTTGNMAGVGTLGVGAITTSGALTYGGVTLSNSVTGTGSMVLATSPTLTTPALGTPSALVGTNITGTAAGLTAGNVTTNANLTGAITSTGNATVLGSFSSANLAGALTDETGSGSAVFATSPTLVTPALGTPASGVVTNLTGTASININGTVGATTPNTGAFTDLSFSGTGTFSGGTANGVAFLNASKVLTTGSALTFDGTNLANTQSGNASLGLRVTNSNAGTSASANTSYSNGTESHEFGTLGTAYGGYGVLASRDAYIYASNARNISLASDGGVIKFGAGSGATERMRLDSSGNLGIGTSSPTAGFKLDVNGNARIGSGAAQGLEIQPGALTYLSAYNRTTSVYVPLDISGEYLRFSTNNGTERMRLDSSGNLTLGNAAAGTNRYLYINGVANKAGAIDFRESGTTRWLVGNGAASENGNFEIYDATNGNNFILTRSGNLGLGVTPSAWGGSYKALQIGYNAAVYGHTSVGLTALSNNVIAGVTNELYLTSDPAASYSMFQNTHRWFVAPSGTAGNAITFTQAMSLTGAGNLVVGDTASDFRLGSFVESGANRDMLIAAVKGVTNGFTVKWNNSTSTIRANIQNLPTSSAGLSTGDLWNDGGTLKVA